MRINNITGTVSANFFKGDGRYLDLSNNPYIQTPPPATGNPLDILTLAYNGDIHAGKQIVLANNVSPRVYNTLYMVGHSNISGAILINGHEVLQLEKEQPVVEGITLVGLRQMVPHSIGIRVDQVSSETAQFDLQVVSVKI